MLLGRPQEWVSRCEGAGVSCSQNRCPRSLRIPTTTAGAERAAGCPQRREESTEAQRRGCWSRAGICSASVWFPSQGSQGRRLGDLDRAVHSGRWVILELGGGPPGCL